MRFFRTCLVLGSVLSLYAIRADAQESDPQPSSPNSESSRSTPRRESAEDRSRNREFERFDTIDRNLRARALSRLASTGTLIRDRIESRGPDLEIVRRIEARENLMVLAGGLQALYDLGATTEHDPEFWRQLESRT